MPRPEGTEGHNPLAQAIEAHAMIRQHIASCTKRDEQIWQRLDRIETALDRSNARWMILAGAVIAMLLGLVGYLAVDGPPWRDRYHIEEMGPVPPTEEFLPFRRRPRAPVTGGSGPSALALGALKRVRPAAPPSA